MKRERNPFVLRLFLLCATAFMWTATFAQSTITVSGTVQDDFETLPGVSISVKGTTTGVITDLDGKFTVNVPSDKSVLVFSYVGYVTQEITVGAKRTINVTMATDDKMLDEVVVIGYGTVKKKDLTGAVSSVSASSLAAVPAMTAAQALQGKAAGVNIITASGAPGAGAQITVRGGTSITQGTAPLYIVDGFEMSDALSTINANDIESIDILKDASSTAIYGARGSNGIVLITTKSGKKGKASVTYNAFFSFDQISKKLDMMDNALDYTKYQYEMAVLQGKPSQYSAIFDDNTATDGADFYSGAYGRMNSRYATADVVDWQDKVFGGTALTQNHNVNITGGSETLKFLVSYNHNGQDGLLANHNQAKNTVRAKLNAELFKGVRFDFNTMFSNTDRDGGGAYSGMKNVLLQPIHGGTRFTRDELLYTQTYPELSGLDSSYDTANPIVQNNASTSNKRSRLFTVNAGIEFDFLKHFTWRTAGQYTWSNGKDTGFTDENSTSYLMDPENTGMTGYINNSESYKYQVSNTLNYAQTFASVHRVNVLLGHEVSYSESTGNKLSLKKFQYPNKGLDDISLAEVNEKSTSHSRGGMVSLFARANYSYNDRYLLTATIRTDGSSKFAKGNKWGTFPSASVAWRVSEESFWKENSIDDVVNNLKLRVGYGVTGNNDIEGNRYTTSLKQTSYPMNNNTGNPAFIVDTTLGNANLQWESLKATNIGLDISLFNSRVNLTAEWYNNEIADLLMKCVLPASTGYANQFQNIGKMRNRGWEFTLNTTNIQTRNFRWTSDFNISFNTSKVVSLEKDIENKTFSVGSNRAGTLTYYAVVGEALGDMYGYKYDGLYTTDDFEDNGNGSFTLKEGVVKPANGTPQPGDMKFAADNEEGDQFTRQMVKIGNGAADFIGGFNNSFTYKGFDFSFFMKFSVGNDIYNATKHSMSPYAVYQNTQSEFGDNYYRLIDPNTGQKATTLARIKELNPNEASRTWSLGLTNSSYITYPSSYYVEDGSYLRLAQVTIGYTFPKNWLKKAMISNARIYFTGNNLLTITGYDGYDPEVTSGNDNVVCTPGYDSSTYPRSRSYVVGLNLTF